MGITSMRLLWDRQSTTTVPSKSVLLPGVRGQTEVITKAHAFAALKADSISYVEAHGTGTSLGDPVEVTALNEAFRLYTSGDASLFLLGACEARLLAKRES